MDCVKIDDSKTDPHNKRYIMEYGQYMNKATKIRILDAVMYYIDDNANTESDHMQLVSELIIKSGNGLNIILDKLPQSVCNDIYNIIYRRIEILNSPHIEKHTLSMNFNFGDNNDIA